MVLYAPPQDLNWTDRYMNNHVHRALLENTERMRKEKDKKGNAQKRLTLLNK